METIWAPWRIKYILSNKKENGCVFCNALKEKDEANNLVLHRSKHSFIIMNKFPYNPAHIMVVPNLHVAEFHDLSDEAYKDMNDVLKQATSMLKATYHPEGLNIGINLGKASGAGIDDHLHYHVIPRWTGDTNFMPVIGNIKIVSEALEETYNKLKQYFG